MKNLIMFAALMAALMGSSVAFAEKAPAQPVAQSSEATVSAFQGVDTVAVSSEELKTAAGARRPKAAPAVP